MIRKNIIRKFLQKRKNTVYLEIGVDLGRVFFDINSKTKIAVDPEFKYSALKRFRRTLLNPFNIFARFYEVTSDGFFEKYATDLFCKNKIDVCLVDGMHEYAFALRDIENSLKYLKDDGMIIVHDCNPLSKESACSFQEWKSRGFTGEWNGDVWKAIVHIRSTRNDVQAYVLDTDQGLGIIAKGKPESVLSFTPEQIKGLTYEEFDQNRKLWLNLKPESHLSI